MPDTLICTVGTSLITNAARSTDSALKPAIDNKNIQGTIAELLNLQPDNRSCGAEINSICSIVNGNYLSERKRCLFLVSDTAEGNFTGAVLKGYLSSQKSQTRFENADFEVITGLSDKDINLFKNTGLKNLVRLIGKETRKTGAKNILINATGGYKAQISFAGMIGQALGIPVAYMHERFSDVIILPPQPVNLDIDFWLENSEDFFALNDGTTVPENVYCSRDNKFEPLIESIEENGNVLTTLTATGQLFHETFSEKFAYKQKDYLPADCEIKPENKKRTFEAKNNGKHAGLSLYLDKICNAPFVKTVTTHYYNPDLNAGNSFQISSDCRNDQIEGTFSGNGKTTRFFITVTTVNARERFACLAYFLNNLQNGCY